MTNQNDAGAEKSEASSHHRRDGATAPNTHAQKQKKNDDLLRIIQKGGIRQHNQKGRHISASAQNDVAFAGADLLVGRLRRWSNGRRRSLRSFSFSLDFNGHTRSTLG